MEEAEENVTSLHPSKTALIVAFFEIVIPLFITRCIVVICSPAYGEMTSIFYKIICILVLLELVRRYFNDIYSFGEKNVTHKSGIISLHYRCVVLKYIDIREIRVTQSILGRIFNYGTLALSTAATGGEEMICSYIDNSAEIADSLQTIIAEQKKKIQTPIEEAQKED